ncbi:Na+/Pi symporter [Thecaphora frezii]
MPKYHEYDYLFAFSLIGAFVNSWGIGANDVANSFATSVSSKSLTFRQAMFAAAIFEFLGAVLVGARVASTIKNDIVDLSVFNGNPGVVMLGFTCAIIGSASWLTFATFNAMPVSTTHTTVGSIIGIGIAASGSGAGVHWGWDGVAQIFASWGIAPAIAGAFAAIVFLFTKFVVLRSSNPVKMGLITAPFYFFAVACILTTAVIVKGSPSLDLDELPDTTLAPAIILTGVVIMSLSILFWLPYVYGKVVKGDYTLQWYHFFYGPLLWRRPAPEDAVTADSAVPDYRITDFDHLREKPAPVTDASDVEASGPNATATGSVEGSEKDLAAHDDKTGANAVHPSQLAKVEAELARKDDGCQCQSSKALPGRPAPPVYKQFDGNPLEPWNLVTIVRYNLFPWIWYNLSAGLRTDIHAVQAAGSEREQQKLKQMHDVAAQYDNKVEHLYSFMQVMTACTMSFSHGAGDVSNSIGPLAVVFGVWSTSMFPKDDADVPIWTLVFGGAGIVIGLGTYGWRLMSILGNRLTMHSPSRGFSMEFGASITVVMASMLGLPISSTQCITGATMAVSLCEGNYRSFNWRMLGWIFFSWILTLPIAGLISGCLFAIVLNAPSWNTPIPVV